MFSQQTSQTMRIFPTLPDNVLATGYYGLQLTTHIDQPNRYQICRWRYEGQPSVQIFTPGLLCGNRSVTGTSFSMTCTKKNNQIVTSLIVEFPVQSKVLVRAECVVLDGQPYEEISFIILNVSGNEIVVTKSIIFFVFSCIFILLSRARDQCAVRARLGVAGHLSTTPRWGNSAKCCSQRHNKSICWLVLHSVPLMLSVQQGSCEYQFKNHWFDRTRNQTQFYSSQGGRSYHSAI